MRSICGIWSPYFEGIRAVHTSAGSVMWVSASITAYFSSTVTHSYVIGLINVVNNMFY